MEARGWFVVFVGLVLFAGCLGLDDETETGPEQVEDASVEEERTPEGGDPPADASGGGEEEEATGNEEAGLGEVDPCKAEGERIRALIEEKQEDPFGNSSTAEPEHVDCGSHGVVSLVAHGLEGARALQLGFTFEEATTCQAYRSIALGGTHHVFYFSGWETPEGPSPDGAVMAGVGLPVRAFAGPVNSDEIVTDALGTGSISVGWSMEDESFVEGEHRFTIASEHWSGWDTPLTQGSALWFMFACEDPFTFDGVREAPFEMFTQRSMDQGAGASTLLFTGASVGAAVDADVEDGTFWSTVFVNAGGAVMEVSDAEETRQHVIPPSTLWFTHANVPSGSFEVTLASGGSGRFVLGLVHGPMEPIGPSSILA